MKMKVGIFLIAGFLLTVNSYSQDKNFFIFLCFGQSNMEGNADQGGACASMNKIIAKLPQTIPNSFVIPSNGCTSARDHLHFTADGYRKIGTRYAVKMLSLIGYMAADAK